MSLHGQEAKPTGWPKLRERERKRETERERNDPKRYPVGTMSEERNKDS
jgi:hypothetical protein